MSELNDMTCAELADVAAELALGVLTGRERAMAIAHLDRCDECREDVRQLMATGEQLLELLPPAEPPAGFETRVLERLGLPAPAEAEGTGRARLSPADLRGRRRARAARCGRRRDAARCRPARCVTGPVLTGPVPASQARRRPGLAARGGPGGCAGCSPPPPSASPSSWRASAAGASARAPRRGQLGRRAADLRQPALGHAPGRRDIFVYSGESTWLYMSVDMGSGNEAVTCQVVGADGRVTTIGTFQLADGYGSWGSPDPGNLGALTGARLVSADGTVLATATFH